MKYNMRPLNLKGVINLLRFKSVNSCALALLVENCFTVLYEELILFVIAVINLL